MLISNGIATPPLRIKNAHTQQRHKQVSSPHETFVLVNFFSSVFFQQKKITVHRNPAISLIHLIVLCIVLTQKIIIYCHFQRFFFSQAIYSNSLLYFRRIEQFFVFQNWIEKASQVGLDTIINFEMKQKVSFKYLFFFLMCGFKFNYRIPMTILFNERERQKKAVIFFKIFIS